MSTEEQTANCDCHLFGYLKDGAGSPRLIPPAEEQHRAFIAPRDGCGILQSGH